MLLLLAAAGDAEGVGPDGDHQLARYRRPSGILAYGSR